MSTATSFFPGPIERRAMTEHTLNPKVDAYVERLKNWVDEVRELRAVCLDSGLGEDLKWGVPCYTLEGRNVVLIHSFKEYCALLFFKGALLKDAKGILIRQTDNVQAARQVRFKNVEEIRKLKAVLKAYIAEAVKVEKSGLKVELKKTEEFSVPEEFQAKLDEMLDLKTAFEALTPGRRRAYLLHFSSAKQSKTRTARVLKAIPDILSGKGLDD
ncbi:YdeI/OmpD-associated family protein [Burkholderia sp. LMU1-1-1.1]|uniref:YdeI/OmpD-associated family protein n=1 Tax=Burkholderia sp. LMU1-1-1.1 TaxID=3135266 RepID=UPI003442E8AC